MENPWFNIHVGGGVLPSQYIHCPPLVDHDASVWWWTQQGSRGCYHKKRVLENQLPLLVTALLMAG